ncbi:hypothetical protein ERHA54_32980 [Erwinia rhapontici]|nr:hypothetical protein ERHA54_32980 [Erwinia rhapontici]
MGAYLLRRLLLIIPTLWAIITINFFIVQIAPGGPVDQAIANIEFGQTTGLPGAGRKVRLTGVARLTPRRATVSTGVHAAWTRK